MSEFPAVCSVKKQHVHFKYILTNASLNGGWVPETSGSFHYWHPAPRWRPLAWLANSGNQAMSPHAEGKTGTRHTELTVEREMEGRGNA